MKRDRVTIDNNAIMEFVLDAIVQRLTEFKVPVAVAAFDGVHLHVLQQCTNHDPKIKLGIAKQYATSQLKSHIETLREQIRKNDPDFEQSRNSEKNRNFKKARGSAPGFEMLKAFDALNLKLGEGLWSTGSHATPITCERHFGRASNYISDHADQGGIVIAPTDVLTEEQQFLKDFGSLD